MTDDELAHISAKIRFREAAIKVDERDVCEQKLSLLQLELKLCEEYQRRAVECDDFVQLEFISRKRDGLVEQIEFIATALDEEN